MDIIDVRLLTEDSLLEHIARQIEIGNAAKVKLLTNQALAAGFSASKILENGMIPGMRNVGIKLKNNQIFLQEVLICVGSMRAGMHVIKPILHKAGVKSTGKIALGTVKGDIHSLGREIVGMMLEGGGFEVIDLGTDVPKANFIDAIRKHQPAILGLSTFLTATLGEMENVLSAIEKEGLRKKVKIMIGGGAVTSRFADRIGADGYAHDAGSAVDKAKQLLDLG